MYDTRQALKTGSVITCGEMDFEITGLIGRGGNAVVYAARYADSLVEGGVHKCVLKELFPYRPEGGIYRGENGEIICEESAREFFEIHKTSFMRGIKIHLQILKDNPDSVGTNFNSFEKNNTVYSVLGLNSVSTLKSRAGSFKSLSEILRIIIKLLKAVDVFHKNNILHLDISPENVILSEANGEERVLLIDFNSCRLGGSEQIGYISANPKYSAPEVKLCRMSEISAPSDIFSVCAVFAYLIDGGELVYTSARLNNLEKSKILENIPRSAVACLLNILSRGLRSKPALRFKSAAEMIEACDELQNRIDNTGITRASVWEASRLICGGEKREYLENNIFVNGKSMAPRDIFSLGNTILTGEGGIGKTTLFKRLWYENTRRYGSDAPVYFFVPLYRYDEKPDFIKRYIVSKLKFGGGISTVADAVQRLTELMNENKPFLYLMLDGFNEISADGTDIIREIDALAKMNGVRASVSARADILTGEYLKAFTSVSLMPLDRERVRAYLNGRGAAYPDDAELARLLTNPLMLTLYAETENVFQKSGDIRPIRAESSDIIHAYLSSLIEARKQYAPEDKEGLIRLSYVTEHLFPALCAKAEKRVILDYKTVRAVCAKDYKRMRSRAFGAEFKKYSGRSEEILGGAKNADEWTNIAFNRLLLRDTALMLGENDSYYPIHMKFSECLAEDHRRNMKRYGKARIGARVPAAAAVFAACLCAAGTIYYYMPNTHPLGKREIQNNRAVMGGVVRSANNAVSVILTEKNAVEYARGHGREETLLYLDNAASLLGLTESYDIAIDNLSEKVYRGLDAERVEKILDMTASHREWQKDMFERLSYALSPESVYTEEEIDGWLDYYEEYADDYERLTAYELCLLIKPLNNEGAKMIKTMMQGGGSIVKSFNNALGMSTEDLESGVKGMEEGLGALNAKMDFIRVRR